jgi:hypothetical protein
MTIGAAVVVPGAPAFAPLLVVAPFALPPGAEPLEADCEVPFAPEAVAGWSLEELPLHPANVNKAAAVAAMNKRRIVCLPLKM